MTAQAEGYELASFLALQYVRTDLTMRLPQGQVDPVENPFRTLNDFYNSIGEEVAAAWDGLKESHGTMLSSAGTKAELDAWALQLSLGIFGGPADCDAAPPQAVDARSIEERLARLDALHAKGLLTDLEYARQRARLIAEI